MFEAQIEGLSKRCNHYGFYTAVGLVFLLFITVIGQIFTRNLNIYFQGTIEGVQIIIVWIAFIGLPYIEQIDGHIRIQYLHSRVSPSERIAGFLDWFSETVILLSLIGIGFSAVLTNIQFGMMTTSQLRLPVAVIYAPLAIGSGLAIVQNLRTIAQ